MKAIKIDAYANTVTEIEISEDYREISRNIGCELFCQGASFPNGDTLYVDDEGWLNGNVTRAFAFNGRVLAGNGLILGCNPNTGDSRSVKTSLENIKGMVKFMPEGASISDAMREHAMDSWTVISF